MTTPLDDMTKFALWKGWIRKTHEPDLNRIARYRWPKESERKTAQQIREALDSYIEHWKKVMEEKK